MRLKGKRALVTGAARGIGRGCALELARAGADVVINDRTDSPVAREVVEELRGLGVRAELIPGDVFSRTGCQAVVEGAIEALSGLDILVSNPAFSRRGEFLDYDPAVARVCLSPVCMPAFPMCTVSPTTRRSGACSRWLKRSLPNCSPTAST